MNRFGVEYFSRIYAGKDDPWGFETSWYERRKYALTLASLPRDRYRSAFEPGCSFGVLSELLAPRCDALTCYEIVPRVAVRARERLQRHRHVRVKASEIPADWPDEELDLIVLSEVLYYLGGAGLERTVEHVLRTLGPAGHVVAVHYRKETDYPSTGDTVHAQLERALRGVPRIASFTEASFRIDVFERGT